MQGIRSFLLRGINYKSWTGQWGEQGTLRGTYNASDGTFPVALEALSVPPTLASKTSIPTGLQRIHTVQFLRGDFADFTSAIYDYPVAVKLLPGDLVVAFVLTNVTPPTTATFNGTAMSTLNPSGNVIAFYHVVTTELAGGVMNMVYGGGLSGHQTVIHVFRGADTSSPIISNAGIVSADPDAISPTDGSEIEYYTYTHYTVNNTVATGARITAVPAGYTEHLNVFSDEAGFSSNAQALTSKLVTNSSSENPGTFTDASVTGRISYTIAIRGVRQLRLRTNYRVVQPTTFTNSATFYSHTVSVAGGTLTLTPALHTNTQSFFSPTIRRTMKPSVHTNSQNFYTQTLRRTLQPSLHSDGETFFAPAVRRTLRPAVHTNSSAFFTQTLRLTLKPSLFSDGDTFFAPAVRRVLRPSLFTNSQAFFTHSLRSVLKPSLHSDGETFFTQTIRSTLKPALYTNSQAYFTHSLRVTLKPTLYSDGDTFYTHSVTVAGTGISPALFTNSQSFFTHSLRATVKPTLHTNSQAFFTQSLRLTLRPEHNQNLQSFFNPRLSLRLSPAAYVNSSAFFSHAILLAGFVAPSLWVNSQVFYGPTVTSAALGGYPYDDTKKKKKLVFPYVEEAPKTKRQARKAKKRLNEAVVEKISTRLPSPPLPQLVLPDNVRSVTAEYLDAWFEGQLKAEIAAERSLLALAEESYRDFLQRESVATSALEELFPEGEKLNEARLKEEEFLIQLAWSTYFDS